MAIREDLREIQALAKQIQVINFELETDGKSECLEKDLEMLEARLDMLLIKERRVKISTLISCYAKACEIDVDQVKINTKLSHMPYCNSKAELLKMLQDGGDYYKIKVEISGGKRNVRFKFTPIPYATLEDGSKSYKHIKLDKARRVWIDEKALPMYTVHDVLLGNVRIVDPEQNGYILKDESLGKIAPSHMYGKIFVNALINIFSLNV